MPERPARSTSPRSMKSKINRTSPRYRAISDLYIHSPSTKAQLRIGILVDTPKLTRASATVLRDIMRSDFARLQLVVYNAAARFTLPFKGCLPARLWCPPRKSRARTRLLWEVYKRLDKRIWHVDNDPLGIEDCEPLFEGLESLEVEPITTGFADRFPEDAIEAIASKRLDVLLRFGFNLIRGSILNTAKYGVWSFHYGDEDYYRGGPAYFWELYEQNPLSGVTLQILTEEPDANRVLEKALFATQLDLSVIRNRIQPYWGSAHFMIQKLWELHAYGWESVEKGILTAAPYSGKRKTYCVPNNIEMARWIVPHATKKLYSRVKRTVMLSGDVLHWQLAIRTGGHYIQCEDGSVHTAGFRWIESPKGHFYADPFVLERDGQNWLFFEDYDYQRERGAIACADVSPGGEMGEARLVLEADTHLSYPYIFSEGDSIYMIPENGLAEVVQLYRCTRFPEQWSPVAELFHGPAVDTSVWKQDGKWWFFTTLLDRLGQGIALYLFFSESLTGPWLYHPANPISHDVRNARGAGRLFQKDGKLIRPSQSSIIRYGYSFALNEVVKLTQAEYQERPILSVGPNWRPGLQATHTYNRTGSIEVIDGQTFRQRSRL